jgi:NDP-sugar pyrophosphorylase family protein
MSWFGKEEEAPLQTFEVQYLSGQVMKAMILAAGLGTRLQPLTFTKPKALLEIQGVAMLEHTILYLKHFGIRDIIINIHHLAGQIIDFIRTHHAFGVNIAFSDESNELLDTGGGLCKAKWFFNDGGPFVLASSDVITNLNLAEMINYHIGNKPLVTLAIKNRPSTREFLFDKDDRLCGWKNNLTQKTIMAREIPNPEPVAFSVIHIIEPLLFNLVHEQGVFSITDVYLRLAAEYRIMGFRHEESQWLECGRLENLNSLNQSQEVSQIFQMYHHD